MKKIFIKLKENEFQKSKLVEIFENMIFVKKAKYWEIEIFTKSTRRDINIIKNLVKINHIEVIDVDKIDWVIRNQSNDYGVETYFFFYFSGN